MSNLALVKKRSGSGQEMYTTLSRAYGKSGSDYKSNATGADVININGRISTLGKRRYPLWNLSIGKVPLSAWLYHEGSHWFADIEDLNVSSFGSTPKETIDELEQHIRHFILFYENADDNGLTAYARTLRKKFSKIVINE